ncbi:MAG TPA: J domain-containing protein [Rhodanobacteraceae bacterium]
MSAFDTLGLPPHASERDIKRAYAALLRNARPEDDPARFQHLYAAYQEALRASRGDQPSPPSTSASNDSTPDDPMPVTGTPPEATFDANDFCAKTITIAIQDGPKSLQAWLDEHPALWSFSHKSHAGNTLIELLAEHVPPISTYCSDILFKHFNLDALDGPCDPLYLHDLQQRMQIKAIWESGNMHALSTYLKLGASAWRIRLVQRQLRRAPQAWRLPGMALNLQLLTKLLNRLDEDDMAYAPMSFHPAQIAFWREATRHGSLAWSRIQMWLTCAVAWMMTSLIAASIASEVFAHQLNIESVLIIAAMMTVPIAVVILWRLVHVFIGWQCRREQIPVRWPWLCMSAIPALCTAVMLVDAFSDTTYSSVAIAIALLSILRLAARWSGELSAKQMLAGWYVLLVTVLIAGTSGWFDNRSWAHWAIVITAGCWGLDMWRNWSWLRVWQRLPRVLARRHVR